MEIEIEGGKYKFYTKDDDYRIFVDRYGVLWITIDSGHKAVLAMMQEVERLRGTNR